VPRSFASTAWVVDRFFPRSQAALLVFQGSASREDYVKKAARLIRYGRELIRLRARERAASAVLIEFPPAHIQRLA